MDGNITGFLRDESGVLGNAVSVALPENRDAMLSDLSSLTLGGGESKSDGCPSAEKGSVTIQGACTGICGGAVPMGGHILSAKACDQVLDLRYEEEENEIYLTVEPGVTLENLERYLAANHFESNQFDGASKSALEVLRERNLKFWFPPNPTEKGATIGGIVSANSSGSHLFGYGEARDYVHALEVLLPGGEAIFCRRTDPADPVQFSFTTDRGRKISIWKPGGGVRRIGRAGYAFYPEASGIDLFCGAEGTLGILSRITLRLVKKPEQIWGVLLFLKNRQDASFIFELVSTAEIVGSVVVTAADYIDGSAFALLKEGKEFIPRLNAFPELAQGYDGAVLLEFAGETEDEMFDFIEGLMEKLDPSIGEAALAATIPKEHRNLSMIQHGVIEAINFFLSRNSQLPVIADGIVDREAYFGLMEEILKGAERDGLKAAVWGHAGVGHLHLHLLPHGETKRACAEKLENDFVGRLADMNGDIGNPYGVGRLKGESFRRLYRDHAGFMENVRKQFDPKSVLQPGVFF